MRLSKGYITVNRDLVESGLFSSNKDGTFKLFILLLCWATSKESGREAVFNDVQISLKRNQLITSQGELAKATGFCTTSIARWLIWLKENGYIGIETCNNPHSGTLITIKRSFGVNGGSSSQSATDKPSDDSDEEATSELPHELPHGLPHELPYQVRELGLSASGSIGEVTEGVQAKLPLGASESSGEVIGDIRECKNVKNEKNDENGENVFRTPNIPEVSEIPEIPEPTSTINNFDNAYDNNARTSEEHMSASGNTERSEKTPPPFIPPPPPPQPEPHPESSTSPAILLPDDIDIPEPLKEIISSPVSDGEGLLNVWDETLKAIGHIQPKINTLDLNTADILLNLVGVENIQSLLADYIRDRLINKKDKRIIRKACSRNDVYIRSVLDYFKKREEAHRKAEADRKWQEEVKQKNERRAESEKLNKERAEAELARKQDAFNEKTRKLKLIFRRNMTSIQDYMTAIEDTYMTINNFPLFVDPTYDYNLLKASIESGMSFRDFISQHIRVKKDDLKICMREPFGH